MTETYTISTTADTVRRLAQVSSLVALSLRLSGQSPSIILNIIYGTQPYAPLSPPECVASSSSSTRFLTTCHIQPTARPHSTQCDRVPYASSRLALTSWWVSIELRLYLTGSNRKLTKKLKRLIDQGEIFQISHTSRKALSRRPYSTKNDNNTFHFLLAFCCKYIYSVQWLTVSEATMWESSVFRTARANYHMKRSCRRETARCSYLQQEDHDFTQFYLGAK